MRRCNKPHAVCVCVQAWSQPHGEPTVLTKPKIVCVAITLREYELGGRTRYVLNAADYQRLVDAMRA